LGEYIKGDLVRHGDHGAGRVAETSGYGAGQDCGVYFGRLDGIKWVKADEVTPLGDAESTAYELLRLAIQDAKEEALVSTPLHHRWVGGTLVMKPGEVGQEKELPIDVLFHKIVMVRDKLRVMEAKINGNPDLNDKSKVELQGYLTRIYGTLTTFNVLFKDKDQQFSGQKS
jgi:hypothetical protein